MRGFEEGPLVVFLWRSKKCRIEDEQIWGSMVMLQDNFENEYGQRDKER
jgi:hypothetical protein